MKTAALIVGLIGAILTAGIGIKWIGDFEKNKDTIASLEKMLGGQTGNAMAVDAMNELERTRKAGYAMAALGLAALVAAALVFKLPRPSGGVMILAAIVPAALAPKSLIVTFFLIIAGALALLARPRPRVS